jgi:hypothetical protein
MNNETLLMTYYIKELQNPIGPLYTFLKRGVDTWNVFTIMCIIQNIFWYYTTNVKSIANNKYVFENTSSDTLKFVAQDLNSITCPSLQIINQPKSNNCFHIEILHKWNALVEL